MPTLTGSQVEEARAGEPAQRPTRSDEQQVDRSGPEREPVHARVSSLNGANSVRFRETRMLVECLFSVSGLSSHPESHFPLVLTATPPLERGQTQSPVQWFSLGLISL